MTITITVYEQTTAGQRGDDVALELLAERTTARELIRRYVYELVREERARRMRLAGSQAPGSGKRAGREHHEGPDAAPDWEAEYQRAVAAFSARRFLLLADDCQISGLDDAIDLHAGSRVTFLRLLPLAGG